MMANKSSFKGRIAAIRAGCYFVSVNTGQGQHSSLLHISLKTNSHMKRVCSFYHLMVCANHSSSKEPIAALLIGFMASKMIGRKIELTKRFIAISITIHH